MKKALALFVLLTSATHLSARTGDAIETFEGTPLQDYSVVSPISSSKPDLEKAFFDMKRKAQNLGANAIINYQCEAGSSQTVKVGLFKIPNKATINSRCTGTAVKLKNSPEPQAGSSIGSEIGSAISK